jgi:L-ascorbate metabolism protein UlaG (beta-lactamase superfamily)
MQLRRLVGMVTLALLAAVSGGLFYLLQPAEGGVWATGQPVESLPGATVKVLFLGTSSMAWTDGKSTWLIDGFFSRQALGRVALSRLQVEEPTVKAVAGQIFKRLDMPPGLSGILVAHSHYDHSLDAPFLASQYGGRVIGSESTRQIALGQGLHDSQIQVPVPGSTIQLGEFSVRVLKSAHAPTGFTGGFNQAPVRLPAHALRFKEGFSYSFLVAHPAVKGKAVALIQPSAGFIPGQNQGMTVDTVFLGTGGLGKLSETYMADYWQEMVLNTGARSVYLIHWDDFTQPLLSGSQTQNLKPMPRLMDNFPRSLEVLNRFADRDNVRLQVLDAWQILSF